MASLLVGVSVVAVLVISALVALPGKMIGDELRARVDDLPVLFVRLALLLLPEDMRAYYKPDWEGNQLAAFNDETAKYPVTRFVRSFKFGFSLLLGSRQIRKETKVREKQRNFDPDELRAFAAFVRTSAGELYVEPPPAIKIDASTRPTDVACAMAIAHERMATENLMQGLIVTADEIENAANGYQAQDQ